MQWNETSTSDIAGYKVYYGKSSGNYTQTATYTTTSSGWIYYNLTGLADCTQYYIAVSAIDLSGNESAKSVEISVTTSNAGAPSAPTGLVAVAGDGSVTLNWNQNPECDINTSYGYYIYRSTTSGSYSTYYARTNSSTTTYTDTELVNGTTYYYIIKAYDKFGNFSQASQEVSVTAGDTIPPPVPRSLSASSQDKGVYIYWYENAATDIAGYKIYYGTTSGNYTQVYTVNRTYTGGNAYTLTSANGIADCTTYYIRVSAFDLSGNESEKSATEVSAQSGSLGDPSAPTGLVAVAGDGSVTLNWNQNPECDINTSYGYYIYRSTTSGSYSTYYARTNSSTTTYTDTELVNGTTYYYIIKAYDKFGNFSQASQEVSVTAGDTTAPLTPTNIGTQLIDNGIRVSWYESSTPGIAGYKIYYGTAIGAYTQAATYATTYSGYLSYDLTGLTSCTDYFITISAYDLSGNESAKSAEVQNQTLLPGDPSAPSGLSGESRNYSAYLSWSPNSECDLKEYRIYRSLTSGTGYIQAGTTQNTSYLDANLQGDGTYYYVVKAVDYGNFISPSSVEISIITRTIASPSVNPVISPTKETTITLTGTKEANTYLYINNTKTSVSFPDTSWSYTVNLNEGSNTFTLYAKDEAGNQSQSVQVTVVRDTTAPVISSSTPSANAYTSQVANIDILLTDTYSSVDLQASISGAIIKNSSGATVSGAWAISEGHLIFAPSTALTTSIYTVTLYPVDSLGNKGTATFSFTLDTTTPSVQSFSMSPTSPHKAETVTFTIVFNEAMSTNIQTVVSFGKASPYNDYSLSGSWADSKTWRGSFQFTATTGDGLYTVKVSDAKDKAGNIMNPMEIGNFELDTISPDAPTLNPVTTPTKTANQTLSGTKPQDTAIIINNVQRISINTSTAWSYTYPLSEGTNNISITARNAAGNDSSPVTASITLDTTPPVFTVDNYKNPSPTPTQTISGTKEPGSLVKLNDKTIFDSTDLSSTWSYTVTLMEGITNHLVFTASDALGNTRTKTLDILYDLSAPSPLGPGVLVADGKGRGTEVTLSWNAYLETSDIAYYRIYISQTNFTDITGLLPIATTDKGIKTYRVTGLTKESLYYFGVIPVDMGGNYDSKVNTASAIPTDTVAPEDVTITSVVAGYDTRGNFITINWNPSVNSSGDLADQIIYLDSGTGYDSGTSLGKTVTTYTKPGLNDATRYKFKITTKDESGHESAGVVTEGVTRLNNPTALIANPGNQKVALSWNKVSGQVSGVSGQDSSAYVKQYNIYRIASDTQQTDIKTMTLIKSVSPSTTTYTDTGLTNGTTYQYAVTVLNTYGAERTDVLSIGAKPRMDETGPQITNFNIIQGQIITAPITITATAQDSESSMNKIELYIDGTLVKAGAGGSISYFYNVVDTTDGNHTIKLIAYDQYGNTTEEARQFVVSLGPPSTPSITGHTVVQTSPEYLVNITGKASLYTTITLRVNGVVVGQTIPSPLGGEGGGEGAFTFTNIKLIEGDNLLSVKASHRGGESPYSPDYKITVDTGAPPSPVNLSSQILAGGLIRFTWQNASGETPSGYKLYMGSSQFSSKNSSGISKVNTSPITYLFKEYIPPDDGLRYYAVTSLDSSGNESEISNVVSLSSDSVAPVINSIAYTYTPSTPGGEGGGEGIAVAGQGTVKVMLAVSEPLKEAPFFSLEPSSGSPIVLSMKRVDDSHYEGNFTITSLSPNGPTTYKFSGKDMVANRGNAQGTGITIDVAGPVAAIQSPLTLLQITQEPTVVNIAFDEPSVSLPVMELKASNGLSSPITNLITSDNGIHWTGTLDISTLSQGNAEFILKEAKDRFGNIGTTVSSGRVILLYKDSLPPPGVPTGLTAKSEKGGVITLTWEPVVYSELQTPNSELVTYNLYRRAEFETMPTKIKTGVAGSPAQDTPPSDGIYYYSITSVGLLDSESERSAEVSAVSDRTGPGSPLSLSLSLDGSGITAVWDAVSDLSPITYNLYRSNGPITTTTGLIHVAKTNTTKAVDTAPMQSKRFYAVTAIDELGNEGPPSESREIVFPVSPVRNLVLERIDSAAPTLTWQAPADGNIVGYHIYRDGNRITQYPVTATSYTDGYYSGGIVTYGISAVDNLGNESPIKEVTLIDISIGLKQGTVLRRGLLETIPIVVSNSEIQNPQSTITIDTLSVKVGTAPESSIQGPFTLSANSTLQVEKVAATTADTPSIVSVLLGALWSPSPGVTVKIYRTSSADVTGSGTALEIFSDPLIRGGEAKIRLKVNNLGSAQMEFLTSENNGATKKVRVSLKNQDGNLFSSGYLNQRTGPVVNIGSYALARLNPNENVITEPIKLQVPESAPYKVIIEASIEDTYYHYGKPEQVIAPGMSQSLEATISETSYRAFAAPEHTFYPYAQPVLITGQAISNQSTIGNPQSEILMPNVPVKLCISVKGFDRCYTVTTDNSGNFSYTFVPGSNEAGVYSLWAVHPDITTRAVQSTFTIAGLWIDPQTATVRLVKNGSMDIPIRLTNTGEIQLSGLQFTAESNPGITASLVDNALNTLNPGITTTVTLRLTASSTAPDTGYATLTVTAQSQTGDQVTARLDASITIIAGIPLITTSPSYIDTGMAKGTEKIESFTIKNTGVETLKNARIEGPSTPWMTLTVSSAIGDIPAGGSKIVGLLFRPPDSLAQGVYDDRIVIYSDNHIPYTYHIQVTITSNAVGNVLFDVLNEFMEDVADATITVQHQSIPELIYTVKTGMDGTAMLYDIPEGRYTYIVSPPPRHLPYSGSFIIMPGITTVVPIALEMKLIEITWSVEEIVIDDRYEIVINQTFETNVPTAVIVTEPPSVNLPKMEPGQVFNGEFTITNYGLVAADYKEMKFPSSFGDYDLEVLITIPERLNSMQKITVPYKVTKRQTTASIQQTAYSTQYAFACAKGTVPDVTLSGVEGSQGLSPVLISSLLDEVKGYGGGVTEPLCTTIIVTNFDQVICPNTPNEKSSTKSSNFVIIYYCGDSGITLPSPGDSGGTTPGTNLTYAQYLQQQLQQGTGGSGIPGNYSTITDIPCGEGSGGDSGGGTGGGGTGGGGTGGGTEDPRCSGNENILAGSSGFYSGIAVPPRGSNDIVISSPSSGITIDKSRVIIKGAMDPDLAGAQVMIETSRPNVSGIDSSFPANINGNYFAALVPLLQGTNIIRAITMDINGVQREASISVNASIGPEKLILTFTTPNEDFPTLKADGLTTLDVTLTAIPYVSAVKYSWDFNGDGTTDLECANLSTVTASYQQPGLYLPTVTITDTQGNKYTDTTIVNVLDMNNMDSIFKIIWRRVKGSLANKDVEGALNNFAENAKETFRYNYELMQDLLPQISQGMGDIRRLSIEGGVAEFDTRFIQDGTEYNTYIMFIKDFDGIWKLRFY